MGVEVSFTPLGSLVDEARGISYGVVQPGQHVDDGVPIVRVTDIRHGRINQSEPLRIAPEIADKYRRTVLHGGELLLTLVGTVGETAVVPASLAGWNTARAVAVLPVLDEPGSRWVQYALQTGPAREYIQTRLNTTVQATLNLGDVTTLPIPMPPREARGRILSILGALDDKIELNRKMNATLEAMARALFKSWFVDFDPVRAKAEGRAPSGMDAETAKLFPGEFVDSELGVIPKGWSVGPIRSVCRRVESGGTPKRDVTEFWHPAQVPWLTSGEVRQPFVLDAAAGISLSGLESSSAKLWPPGTTIVAMYGATAGEVTFTACELTANQACCGLLPRPESRCFIYVALRDAKQILAGKARGSAQQNLNQSLVAGHYVVLPPPRILAAFEDEVSETLERSIANLREMNTLARIRDELLPRLLSGELPVDAAERAAEEVV